MFANSKHPIHTADRVHSTHINEFHGDHDVENNAGATPIYFFSRSFVRSSVRSFGGSLSKSTLKSIIIFIYNCVPLKWKTKSVRQQYLAQYRIFFFFFFFLFLSFRVDFYSMICGFAYFSLVNHLLLFGVRSFVRSVFELSIQRTSSRISAMIHTYNIPTFFYFHFVRRLKEHDAGMWYVRTYELDMDEANAQMTDAH